MACTNAEWTEADTIELRREYRNAKIRLIFPNTAEEDEVEGNGRMVVCCPRVLV